MSNFDKLHQEKYGKKPATLGYPDDGNGFYAKKMPYKDWLQFTKCQDAHYDFMGAIGPYLTMTGICAINQPEMAFGITFLFVLFRLIFGLLYCHGSS